MAISKTFATGYQVIIDTTINSQSASNNTSSVTVAVKLKSLGSSWTINSSVTKNGSVTIDGSTYNFTFLASLSGNQTKTVYTKTVNVTHGADGKKTLNLSASLGVNVTISGVPQTTWTVSGAETLTTIARASILGDVSNFTANAQFAVTVTKRNTAYHDTLTIKIGSTTVKTIAGIGNGTSNITLTTEEQNKIYDALPNATKGTVTFTLETKTSSSGSSVGTSSKTATVSIPNTITPTISTVALAEAVNGLNSKFGAYVQNNSKLTGTITATAGRGSSIVNYKTEINGTTYNEADNVFNTGTLKTSGSNSYKVTVTDKRGRTASKSGTFNVLAYETPKITVFTVKRAKLNGSTYTEADDGTHAKVIINASITALNNKNDKAFSLGYRLANSTGSFTSVELNQTAYDLNQTVYVANMDVDNAYEFKLTATDYFRSAVQSVNLGTSFSLINFNASGKALAFGGVSDVDNAFQVKLPRTDLSTTVYMTGDKIDNAEKNLFFTSKKDAQNVHNCKLYGGNGNSITSIGLFDVDRDQIILRYRTGDEVLEFGANVDVKKGTRPILIDEAFTHSNHTGSLRLNNGLLLQWGRVTITSTTANVTEKLTVNFPVVYTEKPDVFLIAQTSAPQSQSISVGQGSTTVNSFDIFKHKVNTTGTLIQWFAIGVK